MPFTQSNAPVRPVKEIQFGILSPEDIVRQPAFWHISLLPIRR